MRIRVDVPRTGSTSEGFAPVKLLNQDNSQLGELDLQYSRLLALPRPRPVAADFLLLSATVYSVDKLVPRKTAVDGWTRELQLELPVSDTEVWGAVKDELNSCLSFLTGDLWDVSFIPQESTPLRPRRHRAQRSLAVPLTGEAVCLFSGGVDSLVGAIDWLESNDQRRLVLVGHHDGQMAGPFTDQKQLLERLTRHYARRIRPVLVRVGHRNESVEEAEITLRGRSLVFIGLGIFVASALGTNTPLLIPENGTIALNVPLTPSRRGSCSTRTAHPYYLRMLSRVLTGIGITNAIFNPLEHKTKGEAVAQCLNQEILEETVRLTVSCAKRGHKIHFTHREAKACGRCMPCIYRRAALHTGGWDDELYGDDICTGEVDITDRAEKADDFRACLAFLRRNAPIKEISSLLLANGSLDVSRLADDAHMIQRTMNEIQVLLRDKATPEIRRVAGV